MGNEITAKSKTRRKNSGGWVHSVLPTVAILEKKMYINLRIIKTLSKSAAQFGKQALYDTSTVN